MTDNRCYLSIQLIMLMDFVFSPSSSLPPLPLPLSLFSTSSLPLLYLLLSTSFLPLLYLPLLSLPLAGGPTQGADVGTEVGNAATPTGHHTGGFREQLAGSYYTLPP